MGGGEWGEEDEEDEEGARIERRKDRELSKQQSQKRCPRPYFLHSLHDPDEIQPNSPRDTVMILIKRREKILDLILCFERIFFCSRFSFYLHSIRGSGFFNFPKTSSGNSFMFNSFS